MTRINWMRLYWLSSLMALLLSSLSAIAESSSRITGEAVEQGIVLNGTWKFHWGELLDGPQLQESVDDAQNYPVPLNWNYFENAEYPSGHPPFGCATLWTWLDVDASVSESLALYVREVNTAARFYVEYPSGSSKEVVSVGTVSCEKDAARPLWLPTVAPLHLEVGRHRLVWQISNFHFDRGGPVLAPSIGVEKALGLSLMGSRYRDSALIGLLLVIGLYHLAIFSQRRSDRGSLWFGLLCLSMAGRQLATSRFIEIFHHDPGIDVFVWRDRLEYLTMIFTMQTGASYFAALFPTSMLQRVKLFATTFTLVYGAVIVLTLPHIFSAYVRVFQVALLIVTVLAAIELVREAFRRNPVATLSLLGFVPIIVASINDILMTSSIVNTPYLTPYGFTLFILVQSYLLATRFSRAFATAERLTLNLKSEVAEQTQALREQTEIAVTLRSQAESAKLESDRLRHEAEQHADDLRELDRAKTEFFQNMSHELRTPLTLMILPLERYVTDHPNVPSLEMALRNGRRLQRMVNQLLDLQKTEAGKFRYTFATINCSAFAQVFAEYFEPAAAGKGVPFTVGFPEDGPLFISCDVDGLEKIIFNFLSNALKFTPIGGSIRLEVGLVPATNRVRWSVIDTGVGIRSSEQPKVFEVFSQVDGSTTREYEGTGLGLALCKTLTEEMGGTIGLESEVGEGSTFFAEFDSIQPEASVDIIESFEARVWLQPDEAVVQGKVTSTSHPSEQGFNDDSDVRILVVDDVADMRNIISQVVRDAGYACRTANDGADALSVLKTESFDLIISDWMMPTMSGPELIAQLRQDEQAKQTPVILVTAKSDDTSRYQAFATGADGFLGKPFKPEELLAMVRNLVALKEREQELEELLVELRETQERMLLQSHLATVGHMAQGLAHEIRNPLNFVKGGAEIIRDELSEESNPPPAVRLIERGIERIERIIHNIQDLADGRAQGSESAIEVTNLLSSSIDIFRLSQSDLKVELTQDCEPGLKIKIDEGKLSQVILNLLLNAVRAVSECENPHVHLAAQASHDGDENGLIISVSDNGPGVPEELIDTLFEPFVTQTRDASGTGLGLTISRQMVEAMEGQLDLASNDAGATFEIWLPLKE